MRGLMAKRVRTVKEGTLIVTVDIGVASNTGYCATVDGRDAKTFTFANTREGFEKFWYMIVASKSRFICNEVIVGYESTGVPTQSLSSIFWGTSQSGSSRSTPCIRSE